MVELLHASNQWATRPADERYWTLREMREACKAHADASREKSVSLRELTVAAQGDELVISRASADRAAKPAILTNYAFHQLAGFAKAPGGYLQSLGPELAATCLNTSLGRLPADVREEDRRILLQANGQIETKCIVSTRYKRVWNYSLCDRLLQLGPQWRNPPAWGRGAKGSRIATEADCIPGVSIVQPGDEIQPSGLYASDRDMFAFLVNTGRVIDGSPKGLSVGFFVWNSEVGDKSLGVMSFAFDYVCGNHIVWGASDVKQFRMRHVGDILNRSRTIVDVAHFADQQAGAFEAKVKWARQYEIAQKPEDVVSEVLKRIDVSRSRVNEAYQIAAANEDKYGSPRSVWGVVSGLTQVARDLPYADARNALDVEAGKLLDAF